jgi:hypothetical protein
LVRTMRVQSSRVTSKSLKNLPGITDQSSKSEITADEEARPQIEWTRVVIRSPDDSTGALPIIPLASSWSPRRFGGY